METTTKISWEQVKELLPEKTHLYYVDYNDSLDNSLDVIQECIHEGNHDALYEKIDDWWSDGVDLSYEKGELKKAIIRKFDLDEDAADEIMDEYEDEIRDQLHDCDDSDVIKDLLRNTSKKAMFYDTGYYVESESWAWSEKRVKQERQLIKKQLGLRGISEGNNHAIDMMLRQASYGGRLVLYFYDNVGDYIKIDEKFNTISFRNPHIAVINNSNGSGDHCDLEAVAIKLPINKENLFICKEVRYSYTHDTCGMYDNWCEGTTVSFETKRLRNKRTVEESSINDHLAREKELNRVYKNGGCTAGDMDITRHRNTVYINDYPCGNRCKDCGNFWID
jgi:hypothetical protein